MWKFKWTLVQALRPCRGRTAHRGSRGIALLFHDHGNRSEWGVNVTPRPLFTPGKTQYPLYRRLGGPQGRSGQVRKISPLTGFRYPDRAARSHSLYRLATRPTLDPVVPLNWRLSPVDTAGNYMPQYMFHAFTTTTQLTREAVCTWRWILGLTCIDVYRVVDVH
jgi:hypothetical protein